VQPGVFPLREAALATGRGAFELRGKFILAKEPDVAPHEGTLAYDAESHFRDRPPLRERVEDPQRAEFSAVREKKAVQGALFIHRHEEN